MIKLRLPLKNIRVNQGWGVNYLDFYKQWGLKGHNGVDFEAYDGFSCRASHTGTVSFAKTYDDGGVAEGKKPMKHVEILDEYGEFKTIYLHLDSYCVREGQWVVAGQEIGRCDNTGKYTTGNHLHFGLKLVDDYGNTLNKDNGYNGAIDPTPYFFMAYDGTEINPKDCYKSNAYHRYFRGRPKGGLWIEQFRVIPALIKKLKRMPSNEQVNACTYGGWNWEAVNNDAMYQNWAFLKRSEYEAGERAFQTKD